MAMESWKRLMALIALSLCVAAAAMEKTSAETARRDGQLLHNLPTLRDYALVGLKLPYSDLTPLEADNLAVALRDVLDRDVEDRWIVADAKAR